MMSTRKFANAKYTPDSDRSAIIERVRQLRLARFGPRGQTRFCKALHISASTYHYYEHDRVPPPSLLVQMAQVGRTSLTWLLTGQGSMDTAEAQPAAPTNPVLDRISRLLQDRPQAAGALAAFVELLDKVETVQRHRSPANAQSPDGNALDSGADSPAIPVLGRAAAGVPVFWTDRRQADGLTNQLGPAVARIGSVQRLPGQSQVFGPKPQPHDVALVQLTQPVDLAGLSIAEVLDCPALARRWPGAFALRIDGDSMMPTFNENDLVIISPKVAARSGQPAVVQLGNQVGVTCKIFRRTRNGVRLIPANPSYPTTTHAPGQVIWALRVLARVQIQRRDP